MNIHKGMIKWTVSRAKDTYGYNVVTLLDADTGFKFKASGGGYDMTGTVFAEWVQSKFQKELLTIKNRAYSVHNVDKQERNHSKRKDYLYGMTLRKQKGQLDCIRLDGGCGLDSMIAICTAAGLEVEKSYDRSKRNPELIAFYVFPKQ